MSKVLTVIQPCVPGFCNKGYHISLFEASAYLRKHGSVVSAIDGSATLNFTWRDVPILLLETHFDVVAIYNDFDIVQGFGKMVEYVREFSPHSKIITFGKLSAQLPAYHQQFDIDGIVCSGDYELGLDGFLGRLTGAGYPLGVAIREHGRWTAPRERGQVLKPADFVLPDVHDIPYGSYAVIHSDHLRRARGTPDRMQLVVPVARGCPVACEFCEVWAREGLKERRISVEQTVDYIRDCFKELAFEYVAFYAPTFTLNKPWVHRLCQTMCEQRVSYPWKCTTTLFDLDEELIGAMAAAKCFRISLGVESLEQGALDLLPTRKRQSRPQFDRVYEWCRRVGIELYCYIVVGLPGTTVEGTQTTFEYLNKEGISVGPAIYCDYGLLRSDMTEREAMRVLSRHILPAKCGFSSLERTKLYALAFGLTQGGAAARQSHGGYRRPDDLDEIDPNH